MISLSWLWPQRSDVSKKVMPLSNASLITEHPASWERGVFYSPDSPTHPKPNLETYLAEKDPWGFGSRRLMLYIYIYIYACIGMIAVLN